MDTTYLIIDGNAIVHRAYHAIPSTLTTPQGKQINAVYGFTSMLLNSLQKIPSKYVYCTFDLPGGSFRNTLYEGYKAKRKKMDVELVEQLTLIRDVVTAFNIPVYEKSGYEADDAIGSLVRTITEAIPDAKIFIISGDRDILQLVTENVTVVLPGKSFGDMVFYTPKVFKEKFGFDPVGLIHYKALAGDTSDNIPGVSGIGQKGATELVKQYGDIDSIYMHLDDIQPRLREKLEKGREEAKISLTLGTIYKDIQFSDINLTGEAYVYNSEKVLDLLLLFGFKSLVARIPNQQKSIKEVNEAKDDIKYLLVDSDKVLEELEKEIRANKVFSYDTETTSLDVYETQVESISIDVLEGNTFFTRAINNGEILFGQGENAYFKRVLDTLSLIVCDETIIKIAHNIKFDLRVIGIRTSNDINSIFDTMVAAYVLGYTPVDLKFLAYSLEGVRMTTYSDLTDKNTQEITKLPLDKLAAYNALDAKVAMKLYQRFSKELAKEGNERLAYIFYSIEMPLIPVLLAMEDAGILLDQDYLKELGKKLTADIIETRKEVYELVGHEFNIGSPKQLSAVLFDELNLPKGRKTKTGYATDEAYFNTVGDIHPVIKHIREYKEMMKLNSTYVESLPKTVGRDGKIRSSFNQTIAATGRLSSTNPNLQNIPVRTALGNEIRKAFVADENSIFLSFDYSQVELRILAYLSGDEALIKAFSEDLDIHTITAKSIFGTETILSAERNAAKVVNFSIIYGISAFSLAQRLSISRDDAQKIITKYFDTYPKVKKYIEKQQEEVLTQGYVESYAGRRRFFPGFKTITGFAKAGLLREAVNMPIQGTNADIIKIAMILADKRIRDRGWPVKLILQVHDELIFRYDIGDGFTKEALYTDPSVFAKNNAELLAFIKEMKSLMEDEVEFPLHLKVDVAAGVTWGDLVDISL